MEYLPLDQIKIGESRQRREFSQKALDELAESIHARGLMHPIVLRDDGRTLVAGERRLRAIRQLHSEGTDFLCGGVLCPNGQVPFTRLGDLSPLEIAEAEFEENSVRLDLTWQERNDTLARLHNLRMAQAEATGQKHTIADSARGVLEALGIDENLVTLSSQKQIVAKALRLAEHFNDPEVLAAKSEKEALKIIDRKARAQHRERLLAEFGAIDSLHTFHHGDAFQILPTLAPPFDLLITDPPYGIGADEFGDQAGNRHAYADDLESSLRCYALAFTHAHRLGCRAIFAFCDIRIHPSILEVAKSTLLGWRVWDTPLIWSKTGGMLPVPDRGPRRTYEAIFYAYRGNTVWATTGSPDVFNVAAESVEFGAQKPVELYRDLLSRVALPGDRVLDPFAGTCPLVGSADQLQLVATVVELNKEKLDYASERYSIIPQGDSIPSSGG